jgi:hypothetical protein
MWCSIQIYIEMSLSPRQESTQQRRNGLVLSLDLSSKKPAFLDSFILTFVRSCTSVKLFALPVRHYYNSPII